MYRYLDFKSIDGEMLKMLAKIFHGIMLIAVSAAFFVGSFFYERSFVENITLAKENQVMVYSDSGSKIEVSRAGNILLVDSNTGILAGDIVNSNNMSDLQMIFSGDAVMRFADHTKILVGYADTKNAAYAFKLLSGKVWLNNFYGTGNLNMVVDGALIIPGQSISNYSTKDGQTDIYSNKSNLMINFIDTKYQIEGVLPENSAQFINTLFLPEGTQASVFANKIEENKQTIAKLLFSKLVKEFNYGAFDKRNLVEDQWFSSNQSADLILTQKIRNERLKDIRVRGLKYSDYQSTNYKLDQSMREFGNNLTFFDKKIGQRNLDALYDTLYDAQYLYDNGRGTEAKTRLDEFEKTANQLFAIYGTDLKQQFRERIKKEYEYLSFVQPSDPLYGLKSVLETIYLNSFKGEKEEFDLKFNFLGEKLQLLGYLAENKQGKEMNSVFASYVAGLKEIVEKYSKNLSANTRVLQQQNQVLNNLFTQYPELYRVSFMKEKLYLENQYLKFLPSNQDKYEEIQTIVAQRITFLSQLQNFFLNEENIPIFDAKNIISLLFSEIGKIDLPEDYKVAVSALFKQRISDYDVFRRFLESPEYVDSNIKGFTKKLRFEAFKNDYKGELLSIDQLSQEQTGGISSEPVSVIPAEKVTPVTSETTSTIVTPIKELPATSEITTTTPVTSEIKTKVPRVKKPVQN